MKSLDILAAVLIVVGGLNWGTWGILQFDLVAALLGGNSAILSRIVYSLVGVAAVYYALRWKSMQKRLIAQKA